MWRHLKVMRVLLYNHVVGPGTDSLSVQTKGSGEEGEQLVSLVWEKRQTVTTTLWPLLLIRAPVLRGQKTELWEKPASCRGWSASGPAQRFMPSWFQVLPRGGGVQRLVGDLADLFVAVTRRSLEHQILNHLNQVLPWTSSIKPSAVRSVSLSGFICKNLRSSYKLIFWQIWTGSCGHVA